MRHEVASTFRATVSNWRKSTFSGANGCVEVGPSTEVVGIRDAKLGLLSPELAFPPLSWAVFTGSLH